MIISDLKIHHLRNLDSLHLNLDPRFTFIIGPNGSGKTSILEGLYLLSCGHSFRSREIAPIISHNHTNMTVFARALDESTVSIQKSKAHPTQIKLNNQLCTTTSQLAYAMPAQIFYSDIFQIIDASSSVRRSVLDWGLFHVKHNYLALWKEYRKVLKQRNALLKTNQNYANFIPWDKQLHDLANQLDHSRYEYFVLWQDTFYKVLSELTQTKCTLQYFKGWDKKGLGTDLFELLQESFVSDKLKTFTQLGAHHADLLIESNDIKAKHVLSRGQQKIILIALKLAQAELLERECLFLFDDFAAELDLHHQENLFNYLSRSKGQFVFTATQEISPSHLGREPTIINLNNVPRETLAESLVV
ncbi:MAG: DNA replication/repair protein RecF [Legionella sp.]|jgi:DNA replication and repair protein RecF